MNLDSYEYVSGKTLFDFEFESVGSNGKIRKGIRYSLRNVLGRTYFIKGSTKARTRLYQIGISKNIVEIEKLFDLYGEYNNRLESFTTGRNYEAFFFYRK